MNLDLYSLMRPAYELSAMGFLLMFCAIFLGGLAVVGLLPRVRLRIGVSVGLMFTSSLCWLLAYLWCFERPAHELVDAHFKGYMTQTKSNPDEVWAVFDTKDGAVVLPHTIDPSAPYYPQALVLFKRTPPNQD